MSKRPTKRPPRGPGAAPAGVAKPPTKLPAAAGRRGAGLLSSILGGVARHSAGTEGAGRGGSAAGGAGAQDAAREKAAAARRQAYEAARRQLQPLVEAKAEGRSLAFEFPTAERQWRDIQKEAASDLGLPSEGVGEEGIDRHVVVYAVAPPLPGDESEDPGGRAAADAAAARVAARKERDRRDGAAPKLDTSATLVKLNTQKRDLRTTAQIQQEMQEAKRKQPDAAGGGGGAG